MTFSAPSHRGSPNLGGTLAAPGRLTPRISSILKSGVLRDQQRQTNRAEKTTSSTDSVAQLGTAGNTSVGGSDPGFGRSRLLALSPKTHSASLARFEGHSRPRW